MMTEHEQQIAIAEACGWTDIGRHPMSDLWIGKHPSGDIYPPDYLHDLNAMYDAEELMISAYAYTYFWIHLPQVVNAYENAYCHYDRLIRATAAQRAEAFLRTKGKWKDS